MTNTLQDHCTVDDIDGSFVPKQVQDVMEVEVDDELIVVGGPLNQAHALNPSAALVWRCFDGQGTIDELVADLAEATGVEAAVIRTDVLDLARELGDAGLLDGVEPTPPEDQRTAFASPDPLEQGATLEPFTLPDLEGRDRSLSEMLSTPLLLVNWSPWCGFCVRIAGELAELKGTLAERGVGLALVAVGDAEDNLEVFREAGLDAPTFLKQEDIDPFLGFGTPAAYYLDTDGRVAAPFAYGAGEVPALARELAGVENPTTPAVHDHDHDQPGGGRRHGAEVPPHRRRGVRAWRLGHVGQHDLVDGHPGLRPGRLPRRRPLQQRGDRRDPRPLVRRLGGRRPGGPRQLLGRAVRARIRAVPRAEPAGALRATARAEPFGRARAAGPARPHVGRPHAAEGGPAVPRRDPRRPGRTGLLLPPAIVGWIKQLQPRLAKLRIQLVDNPFATVDARTGELVVAEPTIEHDPAVLDDMDRDVRLGSELPPVRAGRYPLSRWYFVVEEGREGPLPRARSVAAGIGLILGRPDVRGAIDELLDIASAVDGRGIVFDGPEELADRLAETA